MNIDYDAEASSSVSSCEPESSNDNNDETPVMERDEIKEVKKMSSHDSMWVRRWRYAVTGMLLMTAFIVTYITYSFLNDQEYENFVTAVSRVIKFVIVVGKVTNFSSLSPVDTV
jgi:hypothetical protein